MQVPPEQLSVQFGSHRSGGEGDRTVEALRDNGAALWWLLAKLWAATRVNPEQASKVRMWSRPGAYTGKAAAVGGKQPKSAPTRSTGVMGAARREGHLEQRGRPGQWCEVATRNDAQSVGPAGSRRGSYYRGSRVMLVEGRDLTLGCGRRRRSNGEWRKPRTSIWLRETPELAVRRREGVQAARVAPPTTAWHRGRRRETCRRAGCGKAARPVR